MPRHTPGGKETNLYLAALQQAHGEIDENIRNIYNLDDDEIKFGIAGILLVIACQLVGELGQNPLEWLENVAADSKALGDQFKAAEKAATN